MDYYALRSSSASVSDVIPIDRKPQILKGAYCPKSKSIDPDLIYPLAPPQLDVICEQVYIPQSLWADIYRVMRLYPEGLDLKTLGIEFSCKSKRPLGGENLYKTCHVRSVHQLLLNIPDVDVLEYQPGVIGYRLRRPEEQRRSYMSKNRICEKILAKAAKIQRAKNPAAKWNSDDESDLDDNEDSLQVVRTKTGVYRFKIPDQPLALLPAGSHVPQGLRERIYLLLSEKYPNGIDMVLFNERYSQYYKTTINPFNHCKLGLPELFEALSDIITAEYDPNTKLTILKAKSPEELMPHSLNSLNTSDDRQSHNVAFSSESNFAQMARSLPAQPPNNLCVDENEYALDIQKAMIQSGMGRIGILINDIPALLAGFKMPSAKELKESDIEQIIRKFPNKFDVEYDNQRFLRARIKDPDAPSPDEIRKLVFGVKSL